MRRVIQFVVAAALACSGAIVLHAQESSIQITVARSGAPASGIQIDLMLNAGKVPVGVTAADGVLVVALEAANLGKATRMQVVIYDCPNDTHTVVFVEVGAPMPEDEKCRRRVAGWVWFGKARGVVIDLTSGTLQIQNGQSFLGSRQGKVVLAAAAAGAVGAGLAASGGSSGISQPPPVNNPPPTTTPPPPPPPETPSTPVFVPSGTYVVKYVVKRDQARHAPHLAIEESGRLTVTVDGTTIRMVPQAGSKLPTMTGSFNPSTGEFTVQGRRTAAGIADVLFRFVGRIVTEGSNQGRLTGNLEVGGDKKLPGGQSTDYDVNGQKP